MKDGHQDSPAAAAAGPGAPDQTTQPNRPLPRRKLVFTIVAMALFMAAVDMTVVATALGSIQDGLDAPIEWSGWTITIYALGQVLMLPLAGRLSDIYGRKKIFVLAVVCFTVASLACGLVNDIAWLVVLRAVQAVGAGAFLPSASGIVADHFGPNRDRALGMFTSIFPIGGIVGPVLGGVFVTYWSWRGIFLVNVPIGVALIVMSLILIPESRTRSRQRIDVHGLVLLGTLILGTMLGVTQLGSPDGSLLSVGFLLPEAIALAALVLFLRHAARAEEPFVPIQMLRGRGFGVINLINLLQGSAAIGFGALVPLYAESRYGMSSLQAGSALTARAVGMICVAGIATFALRRTGYRPPMMIGFSLIGLGTLATAIAAPEAIGGYVWLSVAGGICGLGLGLALPASNNAVLQLAPDQVATISGLRSMFRQGGSIISVSIATALIARGTDPGITLAQIFVVFGCLLLLVVPLTLRVPEHRGSW